MKLNLGCSDRVIPGFIGVDIASPADQIVDLARPWPWQESSVQEVLAYDVCEHIGDEYLADDRHTNGRIHFMNELHRVLIPGGRAIIETPNAARGFGYYQDPTHVSPYCLSTFKYFEAGAFARGRLGGPYGITAAFRVIELSEMQSSGEDSREIVWKIRAVLEAVK